MILSVIVALVATQQPQDDHLQQLEKVFEGIDDKDSIALCLALTHVIDLKGSKERIVELAKSRDLNPSAETNRFMLWTLGNCYDTAVETSPEEKRKILAAIHTPAKIDIKIAEKYLNVEEATRRIEADSGNHYLHEKLSKMLSNIEKVSDQMKRDPNSMKAQMDKLQEMNEKLSEQLQARVKGLENTKNLQLGLGIFAVTLTVMMGCACYFCFFGGQSKSDDMKIPITIEEAYKEGIKQYKEKAIELTQLEKEIAQEKERLEKKASDTEDKKEK